MSRNRMYPFMSISGKGWRIRIGVDTIRILGMPLYISLYKTKDFSSIAVGECEAKNVMSFRVPESLLSGEKSDFYIHSMAFIQDLFLNNDLDADKTYRIMGHWIEEKKIVAFDIEDAVALVS